MARRPRYAIADLTQHVVQRGNNRQLIFRRPRDFRVYRRYLLEAADKYACEVHCYVFMTNHVHLLITPRRHDGIPRLMQSLGRRYVRYANAAYSRTGTLLEGRYKASLVDSDGYVLACYRYIELNPVRAGLVERPGEYAYSSYACNALGCPDELVKPHDCYAELGGTDVRRRHAYRELAAAGLDEATLNTIRALTAGSWALGTGEFVTRVEARIARPARPVPRGRPRR